MSEGTFKFSDHFWGTTGLEDEGPYPGFVALEGRVVGGKTMLSQFENVLLKRAEMEKAYGHALIKMAESSARQSPESSGELKQGWDSLLQGLKTTGLAHLELGRHLSNDLGAKFKEYKTSHSAKRKEVMKTAVSAHSTREKAYAAWSKAKTTYETKCKESDDAERAAASPPADPKLAEKAKAAAFKAQQAKEKAEYAYKQAVANAESTRVEFESKFEAACEAVEQFDKLRVEELRRAFWVYANLGSIAAVADDNSNEHVRASLVNVDAEKDMLQFVITARTGSVRPVPANFVAYGQPDPRKEVAAQAQEAAKAIPIPTAAGVAVAAAPAPIADLAATDTAAHAPEEAADEEDVNDEVEEDAFAAEEDVADGEPAATDTPTKREHQHPTSDVPDDYSSNTYTVVIAYEGHGEPELTLQVGDVVEINERDEDPWWLGRIGDKSGVVHKGYLEPKHA